MTDNEIMDAAMNADEAFSATIRRFTMHKLHGVVVRVVENPRDPNEAIDYLAPMLADEKMTYWDFGDDAMAKDFIKLQGWKAVARRLLDTR